MTTTMTAEETQTFMRNIAAATSKSVLESLEQARILGIPAHEMRKAISDAVSEQIVKPMTASNPAVNEYAADPVGTSEKFERMKKIEGEYLSVTHQLREAQLLDASNEWIDGQSPAMKVLSPELQRAVKRFEAARDAALKAGVLKKKSAETEATEMTTMMHLRAVSKQAMHIALRSPVAEDSTFRSIMNSRVDFNWKLAIILSVAPVMVAWTPIAYAISKGINSSKAVAEVDRSVTETLNSPEVLENQPLLEGPRYTQLLEWMGDGAAEMAAIECDERKLLPYRTPDVIDLQVLTTPPELLPGVEAVAELQPVGKRYPVATAKEIAEALEEARKSSPEQTLQKASSMSL